MDDRMNEDDKCALLLPSFPGAEEEVMKAHLVAETVALGTTPCQNVPAGTFTTEPYIKTVLLLTTTTITPCQNVPAEDLEKKTFKKIL